MAASYAVLFKTHFWDEFAQRQLDRLKARVGRGDIYVFIDQTRGKVDSIDHPDARVIRATELDLDILGLPRYGGESQFWWSADYPLHLFMLRKPDYDYYVMIEFDVVLNVDLDVVLDRLDNDDVDFVSDPILDPPIERFHWLPSAEGVYRLEQMEAWLTCIAFFSHHALSVLLASKLELGRRLAAGEIDTLPMCEIAIPTALRLAGCKMVPLAEFGSLQHYKWTPPYDEGDIPNLADGAFLHPILAGKRFVTNILRWAPDHHAFFDPDSFLARRFHSPEAIQAALPVLHLEMRRAGRADLCARAIEMMREQADPETLDRHGLTARNLAFGKPMTQSSWLGGLKGDSTDNPTVSGLVCGEVSFHTDGEHRPWWMVDLEYRAMIDEVRVYNRSDYRTRADGLVIELSMDLDSWTEVGRHIGASFGGFEGTPLQVSVGREGRFVRLRLPGSGFLHLDQVHVFGEWCR